jgi:hypothetical protein
MNFAPYAGGVRSLAPRAMGSAAVSSRRIGYPENGGKSVSFVQFKGAYPNAPMTFNSPNNSEGNALLVVHMDGAAAGAPTSKDAKVSDSNKNAYDILVPWAQGDAGSGNTNDRPQTQLWLARNIRGGANTVTVTKATTSYPDPGSYILEISGLPPTSRVAYDQNTLGPLSAKRLEVFAPPGSLIVLVSGTEGNGPLASMPAPWTTLVANNGQNMAIFYTTAELLATPGIISVLMAGRGTVSFTDILLVFSP